MNFKLSKKKNPDNENNQQLTLYSEDFLDRTNKLKEVLYNRQKTVSALKTPAEEIKRRADGFDYAEEGYMRDQLNKLFPGWSWIEAGNSPVQFPLGAHWVVVSGKLRVPDFGIVTPDGKIFFREFFSPCAHRVQFKRGADYEPQNLINLGNDVKAANSEALKKAINSLCNISDDVYRKEMNQGLSKELADELLSIKKRLSPEEEKSVDEYLESFGGLYSLTETTARNLINNINTKFNKEK